MSLQEEDVKGFNIGKKLRAIRTGRRMTLRNVSDVTGLSEGFLSQIENGKNSPSIKTLFKIASAYGMSPADLLEDPPSSLPAFVPKHERQVLQLGELAKFRLTPKHVTSMEVLGGTLEPGGSAGAPYSHGDSDELLIAMKGSVCAEIDGREYRLEAGDCIYYRSSMPHTVYNKGKGVAEVLWVVCPPG